MIGTEGGTLATVCFRGTVPKCAEMRGFGEMAEWFKAAVLKTSAENIALPPFSAKPAQICAEISAFPVRSRRTSRHATRHSEVQRHV